ncbi:MAG: hypothetical protein V4605_08530 [Pseudomonadota bacterium]
MTDINQLAIKHGDLLDVDEGAYFGFTKQQLESLLAEHLEKSSSEPVGYLETNGEYITNQYRISAMLARGDELTPVYLANPLNQALLDSHKRLEEALEAAILGIEFVSVKINLDEHNFITALKHALATIPESVKNINEVK